ncbi:hypothetical protein ACVGWC_03960, partial [Enterobacter hormaechei]
MGAFFVVFVGPVSAAPPAVLPGGAGLTGANNTTKNPALWRHLSVFLSNKSYRCFSDYQTAGQQ